MQRKHLHQLHRIAQLKKEMELAELARLARREAAMKTERVELSDATRTARRTALASTPESRMAERFAGWVAVRHAEIDQGLAQLIDEQAVQMAKAALAFGRQDVLQQIDDRLKNAERLTRSRR